MVALIRRRQMSTMISIMEGETIDLHFTQATAERLKKWGLDPGMLNGGAATHRRRTLYPNRRPQPHEVGQFELVRHIFVADKAQSCDVFVRDRRLVEALKEHRTLNHDNLSPLFTAWQRAGLIERTHRGWYRIID